jgi:hypothetical protein
MTPHPELVAMTASLDSLNSFKLGVRLDRLITSEFMLMAGASIIQLITFDSVANETVCFWAAFIIAIFLCIAWCFMSRRVKNKRLLSML